MISRSYNKNITFISKKGKPMYEKCGSSQFLVHNAQLQNSLRKFYIKC